MDFELRTLKSDDIFSMVAILNKIGFKELKDILTPDKVKEITTAFKKDKEQEQNDVQVLLGFNIVFSVVETVLSHLPSCKNEIYDFLASVSGMTVKQVANLEMSQFTELLISVVQKEDFKDFFRVVARLFK